MTLVKSLTTMEKDLKTSESDGHALLSDMNPRQQMQLQQSLAAASAAVTATNSEQHLWGWGHKHRKGRKGRKEGMVWVKGKNVWTDSGRKRWVKGHWEYKDPRELDENDDFLGDKNAAGGGEEHIFTPTYAPNQEDAAMTECKPPVLLYA